jgi:hypothetical protein
MNCISRYPGLFAQYVVLALAAFCVAAQAGENNESATHIWQDMKWPLAIDPWPAGRAFQCGKADCGADIELYVRPKLGFCNCATGITEDSEIDQVGDLAAIGPDFVPLGAGRAILVGDMKGLARNYRVRMSSGDVHALAIVTSKKCDVVVITIASTATIPAGTEQAALALLNSARVLPWLTASVGIPP